jgi:hypothetical protein
MAKRDLLSLDLFAEPEPTHQAPVPKATNPSALPDVGTPPMYDIAGNVAMIQFAQAMRAAGKGSAICEPDTDRLDARACCRACNALLGRPASDRPQPTPEEWAQVTAMVSGEAAVHA